MSITTSIKRSWNDDLKFSKQCYSSITGFDYIRVDLAEYIKTQEITEGIARILGNEYKKQHSFYVYCVFANEIITLNQLREIFNDTGFNVDAFFSENHEEDLAMVANIGGFLLPFWKPISDFLFPKNRSRRNLFLNKLSPGEVRIHSRIFHDVDGTWYISTHIDHANWMNIFNPKSLIQSHFKEATGDYILGNEIMGSVLSKIKSSFEYKRSLNININKIYKEKRDQCYGPQVRFFR